jgi:hypothetical protein
MNAKQILSLFTEVPRSMEFSEVGWTLIHRQFIAVCLTCGDDEAQGLVFKTLLRRSGV